MRTKHREYVIIDDQFLVEVIDDTTLVCMTGQRWGQAFGYDPNSMVILFNIEVMGLIPLRNHEEELRTLIKATV